MFTKEELEALGFKHIDARRRSYMYRSLDYQNELQAVYTKTWWLVTQVLTISQADDFVGRDEEYEVFSFTKNHTIKDVELLIEIFKKCC